MKPAILIAAVAAVALAGCNRHDGRADSHSAKLSIDADDDTDDNPAAAGDEKTRMSLNLPGGINFKLDVPGRMTRASQFDIDGVGLYPGAKVSSVDVNAHGDAPAVVSIGFAAPGDAAAVADWYQKQFEAKGVKASRNGDGFAGTSDGGDAFTLALIAAGIGKSRGLLVITDKS